jgi:hypothetical protein
MTCTTCSTLNPPCAPACVRCNTPLDAAADPAADPAAGPAVAGPAASPATDPAAADPAAADPAAADPAAWPGRATRPGEPAPDPTEGAKRIGAGLSAAATGVPGSSRDRAAAVQPPGYGLDTGDPEPPVPPGRPAADDPPVARRVALVGALVVLAVLAAGGIALWLTRPHYLDSAAVQRQIADRLTARLAGPVAVRCPGDQRQQAGVTFRCTATDNAGGRRAVTVTVVDNSGKYTWTLGTA